MVIPHYRFRTIILVLLMGFLVFNCKQAAPQTPSKPSTAAAAAVAADLELTNQLSSAIFDAQHGTVKSLKVGTVDERQEILVDQEVFNKMLLGHIRVGYKSGKENTWSFWNSPDTSPRVEENSAKTSVKAVYQSAKMPFTVTSEFMLPENEQLKWKITVAAQGAMELGEVSFPAPFNNNYYSGLDQSPGGMEKLFNNRFYIHRYIGGASSYLLIRKLDGTFPGLLMMPTSGSQFEFYHMNLVGWEGVPQIYFVSKAAKDRLGLKEDWLNGHSSVAVKAGGAANFEVRFLPISGKHHYYGYGDMFAQIVDNALIQENKVAQQHYPGMVLPADSSGLMVLKSQKAIKNITFQPEVKQDNARGSQNFKLQQFQPTTTGPLTVSIENELGEVTKAHYRVIEPIADLIKKRAAFIAANQVYDQPGQLLNGAILVYDNLNHKPLVAPTTYWGSGGYEGGITDALFLAAKNAVWPDRKEIAALEKYVGTFLMNRLQNPGNHQVAWFFLGDAPTKTGRPYNYCHNMNFHYWMYRIGKDFGLLHERTAADYLESAYQTALAMFDNSWSWHLYHVGLMHYSIIYDLIDALHKEGRAAEAAKLEGLARERAEKLLSTDYPYSAEPLFDTTGYEDVYFAGRFIRNFDHMERTARCAMTQKSYSPIWFWSGSDKRYWDGMENNPQNEYYGSDNGETCMHYTATQTALLGLAHYDYQRFFPEKSTLYKSYAALLGVWSLVHSDGSASMCYTPDVTSAHYGFNQFSGDSGLCLYGYLRAVRSYVDTARIAQGVNIDLPFGCNLTEADDDHYKVEVIDGVGRRFSDPNRGLHVSVSCGILKTVNAKKNLRQVQFTLSNPSPAPIKPEIDVTGMWGKTFELTNGSQHSTIAMKDQKLEFSSEIPVGGEMVVSIKSTLPD